MGGIERGERNLSLVHIEKIALGFRVSLADSSGTSKLSLWLG